MTNCVTLSHEDAFANIKLLEELEGLPKKKVYGFGVDGKRFRIMKMDDNFFSRIWFSILKFLRFIKTDENSIKQLRQYTIDHLKCNDYKDWAKTHYKVSRIGIKNLMEENQELKDQVREGRCQHTENDREKDSLQVEIDGSRSTIVDLQLKLALAQSQLAEANADKEQFSITIDEQNSTIDELTSDLASQKKRTANYKKRKTHYKEESAYYKEGWKKEHEGLDIKDYLKEHKLYDAIHSKFHKSRKKKDK